MSNVEIKGGNELWIDSQYHSTVLSADSAYRHATHRTKMSQVVEDVNLLVQAAYDAGFKNAEDTYCEPV
jgi:hypothetical protein